MATPLNRSSSSGGRSPHVDPRPEAPTSASLAHAPLRAPKPQQQPLNDGSATEALAGRQAPLTEPRAGRQAPLTESELFAMIATWASIWNVPQLDERVRIEFSRRFTSSIGRYDFRSKTIRLARWLLEHDTQLLREVLCHEAAHAAAYEVHGLRCPPHGKQWKALMRSAGFEPRVRLPERELPVTRTGRRRSRIVWMHRCPGCNAERATRRRMTTWRCMRCLKAGRHGKLEIIRVDTTSTPG